MLGMDKCFLRSVLGFQLLLGVWVAIAPKVQAQANDAVDPVQAAVLAQLANQVRQQALQAQGRASQAVGAMNNTGGPLRNYACVLASNPAYGRIIAEEQNLIMGAVTLAERPAATPAPQGAAPARPVVPAVGAPPAPVASMPAGQATIATPIPDFDLNQLPALARSWGGGSATVIRLQAIFSRIGIGAADREISRSLLASMTADGIWGPITQRVYQTFLDREVLRNALLADPEFRQLIANRPPATPMEARVGTILRIDRNNMAIMNDPSATGTRRDVFGPGTRLEVTGRREVDGVHWAEVRIPARRGEAADPDARGWIRLGDSGVRTDFNLRRDVGVIAGDVSPAAVLAELRRINDRRGPRVRLSEEVNESVARGLDEAARAYNIPLAAIAGLCIYESQGRPSIRTGGNASARGLCQITRGTWEAWRRQYLRTRGIDVGPFMPNFADPAKNAMLTAMAMRDSMDRASSLMGRLEPGQPNTPMRQARWAWIAHFHGSFQPGMNLHAPEPNQPNPTPYVFRERVSAVTMQLFNRQNEINRQPPAPAPAPAPVAAGPATATGT